MHKQNQIKMGCQEKSKFLSREYVTFASVDEPTNYIGYQSKAL